MTLRRVDINRAGCSIVVQLFPSIPGLALLSVLHPIITMSASVAPAAIEKPASTSANREKRSTTKKTTTTKKPAATKPKAAATKKSAVPKAAAAAAATRPSWKDIIKECIVANKEDVRQGVSRATIKKVRA